MEKVLIEESNVELLELFDQVSYDARKEKLSSPPINEMLYWWTRKPLVVGRAITLSSTLNDIKAVRGLMGLGREKRAYTYIPDAKIYKKKLGRDPSEIKVLDPFGGAGNLIFEAKRLGLDCTVSDYNPVAYLLEKSVLEYPLKYGHKLAEDFEKYAKLVIEKTQEEIGKFYEKNDLVYFWVWCVKCPHCSQRVPLTNQMWIANTTRNKTGIRFHVTPDKNFKTELIYNMSSTEGTKFTQKGGTAKCISCTNTIDHESMINDIATRKDRELIAKQIQGVKKREYVLSSDEDRKLFEKASKYLKSKLQEYEKENLIPDEDIKPEHRKENTLWHYGIKYWRDFFGERQILTMITLLKNVKVIGKQFSDREYAKTIIGYLGFLLCKHLNGNSLGTMWHAGRETQAHALTLRRPSFVFNHVETNPFGNTTGSFFRVINNISDAIVFTATGESSTTKISLESILDLPSRSDKYDLIITDPPYLDDVQYGEQSEFFYVWLRRCLQDYYPELPKRVKLDDDICESWGRFGDKKLANEFFQKGFKKAFLSLNKILKDDGVLVVFFAHSDVKAWNLLLECIRESRFSVVSSYAIHTENTSNVIASGKTSFMSSVVVVCRKITKDSTAYFEDIVPQAEDKIDKMLHAIPKEKLLTIPITDLLIMVYGKVLETATHHTILKSYQKDFEPNFENLISDARDFIMKQIVTKLTGLSINTLGPEMSFYIVTKIFYSGILGSDDSIKVGRTYGLDTNKIEKSNLGTKKEGITQLYYLHEQEFDKKPDEIDPKNVHEQLCYLAYVVDRQGASKMSTILSLPNFKVENLKQIVSLLLKSFNLRRNKKESLNVDELEELKILETIADILEIKKDDTSLDSFFDKK